MRRPPEFELYDLVNDPEEFRNLAGDPKRRGDLKRLSGVLENWRRETDDPFLKTENIVRLKAEVEATFFDGQYNRPEGYEYPEYLRLR